MSRLCRGEAVASQAQAYQRSPFEPSPAERTSHAFFAFSSLLHRLRAGHLVPAASVSMKFEAHAQHVGLAAVLQVLPQVRAGAVDLVPADEVEGQAVSVRIAEDVGGELSLGAEPQVQRQPGQQGLHRVGDVLRGNPLPCPGQRVAGLLPHIGQVHRVDPVRDPARAPHVLPLHARRRAALLLLARLVQRPDGHPPAARPAGRVVQPGRRVPPDLAHRRPLVPRRPAQQPLRPSRATGPRRARRPTSRSATAGR